MVSFTHSTLKNTGTSGRQPQGVYRVTTTTCYRGGAGGKIISFESVCQQQLIDAARARAPPDYHFTIYLCAHNTQQHKESE